MTQLRVAMLGLGWQHDQPSGLNRYALDLAVALREGRRSDAVLVVEPPATDAPAWVLPTGADRHAPMQDRLAAYRRAAVHAAADAHVVDAHFALYALPYLMGRGRAKTPFVFHFHGPWAEESLDADQRGAALQAKGVVERMVYRRAGAVVTLSHAFADLAVERYGVRRERIHVIPPAVDLDRFRAGGRDAARHALSVSRSDWLVVTARRLVGRMGLDVLLRAWAAGSANVSERLVIVGDGPDRGALEQLACDLGVAGAVTFTGRVGDADLVRWYQAADLAVVPSVALEGFGLVVLEALACGTPVLVTDIGGLPEAVRGLGDGDGLTVPAGDAGALGARLRRACLDAGALPDPATCRAHAERFTQEAMAAAHLELYGSLTAI